MAGRFEQVGDEVAGRTPFGGIGNKSKYKNEHRKSHCKYKQSRNI